LLKKASARMREKKFGIAAMVDAAVWLDSVAGLEILNIGRSAFERADCTLEAAGRQLSMKISLQGGWIWLSAGSLDEGERSRFATFPTPRGAGQTCASSSEP
jgi:hypothetical protein